MVKVLPEPVTPSSTCVRSWRCTPSTSSSIACGWSPLGSKSDLMTSALAAFGFLRPRRPMRRPRDCVAEFRPALAQQVSPAPASTGGDAERHRLQRRPVALFAPRLGNVGNLVADLHRRHRPPPISGLARIAAAVAQRLGEFRIEFGGALGRVTRLRRLGERLLRRLARPVRIGEIGAAVPRIVGGGASFEACARPSWGEGVPVCEPMPARPLPMPGLSSSASESSSTGISGRDALARVGLAGSFFECLAGSRLGRFRHADNMGRVRRQEKPSFRGAGNCPRALGIHKPSAGNMDSGIAAVAAIRNDGLSLELDAGALDHLAPLSRSRDAIARRIPPACRRPARRRSRRSAP